MGSREAIGLGVVSDGLPLAGDITTKAAYERRQGNKRAMATGIPRALSHFDWPRAASACCCSTATKGTICARS